MCAPDQPTKFFLRMECRVTLYKAMTLQHTVNYDSTSRDFDNHSTLNMQVDVQLHHLGVNVFATYTVVLT